MLSFFFFRKRERRGFSNPTWRPTPAKGTGYLLHSNDASLPQHRFVLVKKKRFPSQYFFVFECSCQSSLVTGHLEFNWNQKRGTFPKIINNSLCKLVTSNPPRPRHDPMKTVLHFPEVAADVSVFNPGGG